MATQTIARPGPIPSPQPSRTQHQSVQPRVLFVTAGAVADSPIRAYPERAGFEVHPLGADEAVDEGLARALPHAVLVDLDGAAEEMLGRCRDIRRASAAPIVACSLNHDPTLVVQALQAGADDCFILPMPAAEFAARLRAVVRRVRRAATAGVSQDWIVAGDIQLRLYEHRVYQDGRLIELTPTEFRLLAVLMRDCGLAVSHGRLLKQAWGAGYGACRSVLRIYIRRLRSKLGDDIDCPRLIVAVRGVGYRLEPANSSSQSAA